MTNNRNIKKKNGGQKKMNHNEVIKNYFEATDRDHFNKSGNVFFEGDTLYSYGHHFILATKCKNGYLLNGDTYSNSTSTHQSYTRGNAPDNSPIIPFSAIRAMFDQRKIDVYKREKGLAKIEILDVTSDTFETIWRTNAEGKRYEAQIHHLGASLIKYRNKHYISSIDNGSKRSTFFLCQLEGKPLTVAEAYRDLASNLTNEEYEQYLDGEIKRQGEYFMIPVYVKTRELMKQAKKQIKNYDLSKGVGNAHIATEAIKTSIGVFIRKTLRHRQHKMISLGNTWHQVIKNTAKQSWSASGNVD